MVEKEARIIMEIGTELQKKIWVHLSNELSRGKITIPQYNALLALREAGSATMSRLAERVGVTMAATTPLIDKLIKQGMARRERSEKDRRVVRVKLSQKGSKIIDNIQREVYGVLIDLLKKLDSAERKSLVKIYQKIHRVLQTEDSQV